MRHSGIIQTNSVCLTHGRIYTARLAMRPGNLLRSCGRHHTTYGITLTLGVWYARLVSILILHTLMQMAKRRDKHTSQVGIWQWISITSAGIHRQTVRTWSTTLPSNAFLLGFAESTQTSCCLPNVDPHAAIAPSFHSFDRAFRP